MVVYLFTSQWSKLVSVGVTVKKLGRIVQTISVMGFSKITFAIHSMLTSLPARSSLMMSPVGSSITHVDKLIADQNVARNDH